MTPREIYFDPLDVEVRTVVVDGKHIRIAQIAWWRPAAWEAPGALRMSIKCNVAGWQMAREEYRNRERREWLRRVHPDIAHEGDAFRAHIKSGGSVTSFHALRARGS